MLARLRYQNVVLGSGAPGGCNTTPCALTSRVLLHQVVSCASVATVLGRPSRYRGFTTVQPANLAETKLKSSYKRNVHVNTKQPCPCLSGVFQSFLGSGVVRRRDLEDHRSDVTEGVSELDVSPSLSG